MIFRKAVSRMTLAGALILTPSGATSAQAQQAEAGTISGIVLDRATGAALAATTVRLRETHATDIAHDDGRFMFERVRPGSYMVTAERVGYATDTARVRVVAGQTVTVELRLEVSAVQIGDITITGSLRAHSAKDAISAVSVISGAELDRNLDGTVAGTLRNVPGVALSGIGPSTARPVIRGLGGDRILMLEDGQRPGDMSATSADHAVAMDPLTAKRFEVVRGPMALMYGSSALGGVVNVIRDEIPASVPEDTHGSFTSQVSSVNDGATAGGYASSGLGPLAFRGDGSVRRSGDVRTPAGRLENTSVRTYTGSLGVSVAGERGHAGAAYRFHGNEYGIPGGFVGGHDQGVDIRMRRHNARLATEVHPDGPINTLQGDLAYTDYHHVEMASSGAIGTRFDQKQVAGELRVQHDTLGSLVHGGAGMRVHYRDITTAGSLKTPSTRDVAVGGYALEEVSRGPVRFQAGVRYDWSRYEPREVATVTTGAGEIPVRTRTFGSFSGSLGVLYAPAPAIRVGASVSRAYRTPDFNELYSDGPHLAANSYDVGDPDLREETGIGVDAFARVAGRRVQAEVAVFSNTLTDYIFPSSRGRVEIGPQRGRPRLQFTNEDARFTGVEGEGQWQFARRWIAAASASYVRAAFTSERAPIPVFEEQDTAFMQPSRFPPLIPPLNGHVGVQYETPKYFGGADVQWSARQGRTGDFESSTPAYAVPGINAGMRFARGRSFHTVTVRADNVLDAEYRQHLSRIKDIMPEPGRNVSLLYRLSY